MLKPSLKKKIITDTILPIDNGGIRKLYAFSNVISLKINVIAWLEFELTYFKATVLHFDSYATVTTYI